VASPAKRMSAETQQVLLARQAALTALTKHPSWEEFVAETDRRLKQIEKIVLANTLGGGPRGTLFDQRHVDYLRGFANGMKWLVAVPANAENSLERELRKQGIKTGDAE